jgi:hypothetical protein
MKAFHQQENVGPFWKPYYRVNYLNEVYSSVADLGPLKHEKSESLFESKNDEQVPCLR